MFGLMAALEGRSWGHQNLQVSSSWEHVCASFYGSLAVTFPDMSVTDGRPDGHHYITSLAKAIRIIH
uniref:Uncharacterized protein n=1 Tax=Anguilla anguilla TaxID=7936 RepID=A0A0E9TUE2_ANGAN